MNNSCRAASAFGLPRTRTTTSVALNSNLVSVHLLWPPQKLGTPYRILLNKSMILLNLGKTWKPIYLILHTINWHSVSLSVFCRKGLIKAMMMMMMMKLNAECKPPSWISDLACITQCKNSFNEFFALENMGIAVGIVQLRCIQAEM